jgi:hypothetical protein
LGLRQVPLLGVLLLLLLLLLSPLSPAAAPTEM